MKFTKKEKLQGKVLGVAALGEYQEGAVVSRTIINKKVGTVTFFAFAAGQGLSEHTAPYDAMVQVLEGEVQVTIGEEAHTVKAGELIIMPADVPHALEAIIPFKMLLTMIRT